MPRPAAIDVTRFIDEAPLSPFQILIVVLCFLVVAIDGFDTAAIGFIAPAIRAETFLRSPSSAPMSIPVSTPMLPSI